MHSSHIASALLTCLVASAPTLVAQATSEHPYRMPEICGVLEVRTERKTGANSVETDEKTLRHTRVRLYKRSDVACCTATELVEERETSIWGNFRFRTKTNGNYWVVVNWDGKDRSMPVEIASAEKAEGCDKQYFDLMPDGTFQIGLVIEVD